MPLVGGGPVPRGPTNRGSARLVAQADTTCTNAGEYYPINGSFTGNGDVYFSTDPDGMVHFSGPNNSFIVFVGVADLVANKACNMLLTLKYNDIFTGYPTPHEFIPQDKIANIAGMDFFVLQNGDTLQAVVQSDVPDTIFTVQALVGLLFGAP
jgi:hypothetical protein